MKRGLFALTCAALLLSGSAAQAFERARSQYNVSWRWETRKVAVEIEIDDRDAILRAMSTWNATGCVELVEGGDGIVVRWGTPSSNETIAAHTDLDGDERRGKIKSATITIDEEAEIDLESIALHELGHALGLAHSRDKHAAMAAGVRVKRALEKDDVDGVCAIYPMTPGPRPPW